MILEITPLGMFGTSRIAGTVFNRIGGFNLKTLVNPDEIVEMEIGYIDLTYDIYRGIASKLKIKEPDAQ